MWPGKTIDKTMRMVLATAILLALAACHHRSDQAATQSQASPAGEGLKGVHRDHKGRPAVSASFNAPDGKMVSIADFKGKPVLVNLWASWCAPCIKELPTLDKLSRSGALRVVAVSEDTAPHASVVAFLNEHHIADLKAYQDPKMALSGALGPDTVLPTSILVDAKGNEVWRYVGGLDWTSGEAAKLVAEADPASRKG